MKLKLTTRSDDGRRISAHVAHVSCSLFFPTLTPIHALKCLSSVNGSIQQRGEHMSRRLCAPSLKALSSNEQCRHGCEQLAQSRRTQPRLGRRDGICRSYTVGRYQSV